MAQITDERFKELYDLFQEQKNNLGSDPEFAEFLNKRNINPGTPGKQFTGVKNKTFTAKTVNGRRQRLGIETPTVGTAAIGKNLEKRNKIEKLLQKEIAKANSKDVFVNSNKISFAVEDKLKLKPKYAQGRRVPAFVSSKGGPAGAYPILLELDSAQDKVDKVLRDLLLEEDPLKDRLVEVVKKRTKVGDIRTTLRFMRATPTFAAIADEGGELLVKANNMVDYQGQNLTEQLETALDKRLNQPVYTGLGGIKSRFYSPAYVTMKFAKESWNRNQGQGAVQFFDSKGDPITWQRGLKLPLRKVSFSYDGNMHKYSDLNKKDYIKKFFPEVYDRTLAINNLKSKKIDNPYKPGSQITVRDLVKKNQIDAYNWSPRFPTLDILHGPKGIKDEPFTNLRYNTKDINQLEAGLFNQLRSGKISKSQYNRSFKSLMTALPGEDTDIIQRQIGIADKIKKGTMFGYKDMSGSVRGLFEQFDKPTILQIRRAVGCDNADGGRIELQAGGDLLACPAKKFQNDPVGFTNKVNQITEPTSGITKFTNAALGFLKGPGPKTFGIGAGVGAAIGLVKAFRNDDPTTYLSNEDQQKSMLVDMATQPVSLNIERPAILDYQLPALGGTLAASTALAAPSTIKASKSRALGIERKPKGAIKTGLRVLGRGLGVAASPALLAPFALGDIASQISEGDTPEDIATNPFNYLYPAFADQTPKLTRGLSPTIQKIARLGLPKIALRGLSRAGIGGFAAASAIQGLDLFDD